MRRILNFLKSLNTHLSGRAFTYYFPLSVIVIAISFYYWLILTYNVNVPAADDYGTALQFLNTYASLDSVREKIILLFSQHGEHRILVPSLVVLFNYWITGHANFYTFVVIGNLGLAGIAWVLYKSAPPMENKILFLAPIALLIFQLTHWESATFPTPSIQIFYVVLFSQLALYGIGRNTKIGLLSAFINIFLATFTSGSGIFAFIPCGLILLIQRRYKALACWLLFFGISAWFYFYQFVNGNKPFIIEILKNRPLDVLEGFAGTIGSFLNFSMPWDNNIAEHQMSVIIGIIIILFFLYLTFTKYYFRSPVLYNFFLLMLVTGAAIALSRSVIYTPVVMSTISRYKIIPICITACCYIILVDLFHKKISVTGAIVIILAGIWYNYNSFKRNFAIFKVNIESVIETSWAIYTKNDYSKIKDWNPAGSEVVLKESQRLGFYAIPDLRDEYMRRAPVSNEQVSLSWDQILPADSSATFEFDIYYTSNRDVIASRKGWALIKGKATQSLLLGLRSVDRTYFFPAFWVYRPDITERIHALNPSDKANYDNCGFDLGVRTKQLLPGEYEMGIVVQNDDGSNFYIPANKKIIL